GRQLPPLPWSPALSTRSRSVVRVRRSWTKTSATPFVSPHTRFVASDQKTTKRPFALIEGPSLPRFASFPALSTLTRSVVWVRRSRTNTSPPPLLSPGPRLVATEAKATNRPTALIARVEHSPSAWFPALSRLT